MSEDFQNRLMQYWATDSCGAFLVERNFPPENNNYRLEDNYYCLDENNYPLDDNF